MSISTIPEIILRNPDARGKCKRFFYNINRRTVQQNISMMGKCMDSIIEPMSEEGIEGTLYLIDKIKSSYNFNNDKVKYYIFYINKKN